MSPNKNYQRGANFERQVLKIIRNAGYFAIRAAGSHSPADIMASKSAILNGADVYLVQCKLDGKISRAEWDKLIDAADLAYADPIIASKPQRGVIKFQYANEDGEEWIP